MSLHTIILIGICFWAPAVAYIAWKWIGTYSAAPQSSRRALAHSASGLAPVRRRIRYRY